MINPTKEPTWAKIRREWQEAIDTFLSISPDTYDSVLGPDVLRIRYTEAEDHSGNQSIFFKITISDAVANAWRKNKAPGEETTKLFKVTSHVRHTIEQYLWPYNYRNLYLYFDFLSQSEVDKAGEKGWR